MTTPTHPTLGQRLTGLAAALAVLGIVLGLPALFLAIGASPIPDQVPTLDGIKNALLAPADGTLVLGPFKVIGWVAWAFLALSLGVERSEERRVGTGGVSPCRSRGSPYH